MEKKEKTSVVSTADKSIKTVESYWSFGSAIWEARGFFTPVFVIGGLAVAAMIDLFEWIAELGWSGWFLLSLPTLLVTALFLLILSWLWHLRPNKPAGNTESVSSDGQPRSPSHSVAEVENWKDISAVVANNSSEILHIKESLTEADKVNLRTLETLLSNSVEHFDAKLGTAKSHISNIEAKVVSMQTEHQQLAKRTYEILKWRWTREYTTERVTEIEKLISKLDSIKDMPVDDQDWDSWRGDFTHFKQILNAVFHTGEQLSILKLKKVEPRPEQYKSVNWKIEESVFPDSDAFHDYKTFRILRAYFKDHIDDISSKLNTLSAV